MAITSDDLRAEVGAGTSVQDSVLQRCVALAEELVRTYATPEVYPTLPTVISEQAVLSVAVEVFNQRRAPNGVLTQQFATPDGSVGVPVRVGADPLRPAYPILHPYLGFGVA